MSAGATYPKRLIEVDLPIKRISEHARREKSIRHGHISTLHIWWARRPLAACRAVICASLWPDPADPLCPESFIAAARKGMLDWTSHEKQQLLSPESQKRFNAARKKPDLFDDSKELRRALLDFIADFANWDNSTVREYLDTTRALTQAAHEALGGAPGTHPLIMDPFAGGGAIPLEALRVGADAFASDLNPIPVLLNKVILEHIPKYRERLAEEVKKWGTRIKEEVDKELSEFYSKEVDGAAPIAYLWARTIQCEGPGCGVNVPIIRSPILSTRGGKSVSLVARGDKRAKRVIVEISSTKSDIGKPTVKRGNVTCPLCGYTTPAQNVRKQFTKRAGGTEDASLLCLVTITKKATGKNYQIANDSDKEPFNKAILAWKKIKSQRINQGLFFVPNEPLPYLRSIFNINLLGVNEWGQLHNPRQALALAILSKVIRETWKELEKNDDPELAKAIHLCLGLALDRSADRMTTLCRWIHQNEAVGYTFGRQALGIVWDYIEIDPIRTEAAWQGAVENICDVISSISQANLSTGTTRECSAIRHPLPDDSVSCVFTDPPYYDAVPYADLSDFFLVWLKRTLNISHSRFTNIELAPKEEEIVQLSERNPVYAYKTRERFEQLMTQSMLEGRRVLMPNGIGVVVFAHKTTAGWETQLTSMIDAGWIISGSWPIDTEKPGRMRANNSAALASSIHIVVRPRENSDGSFQNNKIGDWRDVLQELPIRIYEWMPRLAAEGVVGADAIFACLGPALEIFSRYSKVEKADGTAVSLKEYLEHVWAAVAKEALSVIFENVSVDGFEPEARLTAMWLWTLSAGGQEPVTNSEEEDDNEDDENMQAVGKKKKIGYTLEFDAARKIAQGLGANLEVLDHLVEIDGSTARLLPVMERAKYLFGKSEEAESTSSKKKKKSDQQELFCLGNEDDEKSDSKEDSSFLPGSTTLDQVHQAMLLFSAGRTGGLKRLLVDEGAGNNVKFWRLAQALSALYPAATDEKRWIDGVLARKKGLGF